MDYGIVMGLWDYGLDIRLWEWTATQNDSVCCSHQSYSSAQTPVTFGKTFELQSFFSLNVDFKCYSFDPVFRNLSVCLLIVCVIRFEKIYGLIG